MMGFSQHRVSDLLRSRIDLFSSDALIDRPEMEREFEETRTMNRLSWRESDMTDVKARLARVGARPAPFSAYARKHLAEVYWILYTPTSVAKPLLWLGSSRADVRAFPALIRRMMGFQLLRVQRGLEPSDWKPVATVGPGVREIRVQAGAAHRVLRGPLRRGDLRAACLREEEPEDSQEGPRRRPRSISGRPGDAKEGRSAWLSVRRPGRG